MTEHERIWGYVVPPHKVSLTKDRQRTTEMLLVWKKEQNWRRKPGEEEKKEENENKNFSNQAPTSNSIHGILSMYRSLRRNVLHEAAFRFGVSSGHGSNSPYDRTM
jgi:hypothetical protein